MISLGRRLMVIFPVILAVFFILQIQGGGGSGLTVLAQEVPALTTGDCAKCHPKEPATIEIEGEKHKTEVDCFDCHGEHPPLGEVIIPQCSVCHQDKPHYVLENCSGCHANAHAPLKITMGEDITKPCLTCHNQQGKEMKESPSAHSEQSCSFCHPEHKKIPDCMECHEPHTSEMTKAECLGCHPVHTPLVITYNMETPSLICASCHNTAYDELKKNVTAHSDKTCAFCHRDRHRVIPTCGTCHGTPHPAAMHKKFPSCNECHHTAHNLDQVQAKTTK